MKYIKLFENFNGIICYHRSNDYKQMEKCDFRLKMLKQRDGDFSKSQIRLHLNPTYLTLENDVFIDGV